MDEIDKDTKVLRLEIEVDNSSDGSIPKRFCVTGWTMCLTFLTTVVMFVGFALKNIEPKDRRKRPRPSNWPYGD